MAELIAFTTTRYRCPHCGKSWAAKANAAKHLTRCFADPSRKTCKTCKHDVPAAAGGWDEYVERHCAEGMDQGPSCIDCGEHPDAPSGCWHSGYAKELRVLCPLWSPAGPQEASHG